MSTALVTYLDAHQDGAKYLVAAVGSQTAGAMSLQTGKNVVDMGGFTGSDPAPTLAKLESLISSGQLHYVLLDGGTGGGGAAAGAAVRAAAGRTRQRRRATPGSRRTGSWSRSPGRAATTGASLYYFAE